MPGKRYVVILVYSTSHAIRAEKVLHRAEVASKLIPVPRNLSSNCGVCLRIDPSDVEAAEEALEEAGIEIEGMHDI
ncbi:MAG: DUF3343 domain-containing protein [Anaerolineales bacterium]